MMSMILESIQIPRMDEAAGSGLLFVFIAKTPAGKEAAFSAAGFFAFSLF